jgi:acyl-CoA thioesterase
VLDLDQRAVAAQLDQIVRFLRPVDVDRWIVDWVIEGEVAIQVAVRLEEHCRHR